MAIVLQQGAAKKMGRKCTCVRNGQVYQLLGRGGQAKQLEMPVTMLPSVENEGPLFLTLDFKQYKGCND
jgi:hypothetical protein